MVHVTCDRCKKENISTNYPFNFSKDMRVKTNEIAMVSIFDENGDLKTIDLCEECKKELWTFLFGDPPF